MSADISKKLCFLIAPIGDEGSEVRHRSDEIYERVIAPPVEAAGFRPIRADQISAPGRITNQIVRHIINDPMTIADLSELNPNVMYELAIRHVVRKPVIHILIKGTRIPFDLSGFRVVIIDLASAESIAKAQDLIAEQIAFFESDPTAVTSPISFGEELDEIMSPQVLESIEKEKPFFTGILKDIDEKLRLLEYKINKSPAGAVEEIKFSRRVFIVHGHDSDLKNELARFLERLYFEPIILHEQPDKGQTIFAKLHSEMSDVGFAFVILTPDDVGAERDCRKDMRPRARQNVIFEHGFLVGHLQPKRCCAIRKGDVELPSDLNGVIYKTIPSGAGLRSIALELVYELRAAGYDVDANKL